jgi:hypothetical protein
MNNGLKLILDHVERGGPAPETFPGISVLARNRF